MRPIYPVKQTDTPLEQDKNQKNQPTSTASAQEFRDLADQKFALDQHAIVLITAVDGTIIHVNQKFCAISQYSEQELLGSNQRILIDGHNSREFLQEIDDITSSGRVWQGEICIRSKGGSLYWVDTSVVPCQCEKEKPQKYISVGTDITKRKLAAEAEDRLTAIVDLSDDAIISKSLEGTITAWNRGAQKLFGYSAEEALGKPMLMLFPVDLVEEETKIIEGIRRGERLDHLETIRVRKDGKAINVSVTITPVKDSFQNIIGASKIARDISERIQMEHTQVALGESEERFQAMANGIPQLAWMAQPDGHVFWYNQRWYDYTGTTFHQMQEEGRERVHDPVVLPKVLDRWKTAVANGQPFDMEFPLRGADGVFRVFLTQVMPMKDAQGRVTRWFGTNTDISHRKEVERLEQRTAELAAANQELEAFTYSVSHDLRAPLRHMGGFARILIEDCGPKLNEEGQRYLQRIIDGTQRMGLLVDELLKLARLGRHALVLQPTHLNSIVEDIVTLLEADVSGRTVEWKIDPLPCVPCDPVLIKQVFQNLIGNALKFTRTRETAVIEVGCRVEESKHVVFVRDNGVGFDMKYYDKLFGVFQRLHRAEEFEGTGIGLATVQRIIHKHGGQVWAEAELNKGATFYFSLEVANANS
jgi:PAS domain S-box-containing protein